MTNDCSDGALPDPDSSYNPELNCFLPLDNDFDFACLKVLEGLKTTPSLKKSFRLPVGHGAQNDVYLLPKEFDEKVVELHFLAVLRSSQSGFFLKITSRVELESGTTPAEPFDEGPARFWYAGSPRHS